MQKHRAMYLVIICISKLIVPSYFHIFKLLITACHFLTHSCSRWISYPFFHSEDIKTEQEQGPDWV